MIKSIIKYPGGKEKELPFILKNLPSKIDRYIEPFVGGGAVFWNIGIKDSIINDKSDELMMLYSFIKEGNKDFFVKLEELNKNWILLENIVSKNSNYLYKLYNQYRKDSNKHDIKKLKQMYTDKIYSFVIAHSDEFNGLLTEHFNVGIDNFLKEINRNLLSKIERTNKIEISSNKMTEEAVLDNIECAFKSAYYMHFRHLYNQRIELDISDEFYCAIFYFIREYCYASMFRYNLKGKFNVPYGGISYNRKDFAKKIQYLKSDDIKNRLKNTIIYNDDFEKFCEKIELKENDFIFLDPPYDTVFSTYANNEFGKKDQIRLANYLKKTKAKFMLVIKNTDFIYELYDKPNFYIKSFDKKYLVSFQNRNDKDVEHLVITNYEMRE